jgi:hypothetical protein
MPDGITEQPAVTPCLIAVMGSSYDLSVRAVPSSNLQSSKIPPYLETDGNTLS